MSNHDHNGRDRDEARTSWRPQDHDERSFDDEQRERERSRGRSPWEDREQGYRSTDRYGLGQSGYTAGRASDDASMSGSRNQSYAGYYEDRPYQGMATDDRFTGRGGESYWQDHSERRYQPERDYERGYERRRRFEGRGAPEHTGYSNYNSGYNQGSPGFGGYGPQHVGYQGSPSYETLNESGYYGQGGGGQFDPRPYRPGTSYYGPSPPAYDPQLDRSGREFNEHYREGETARTDAYYSHQGQHGDAQARLFEGRGLGHRGKGPQGYVRSDERIREVVCEALADDDDIDATHIEVAVSHGEVVLSGVVDDRQTRRAAEALVERVSGVRDVQNQLRVRGAERGSSSDRNRA